MAKVAIERETPVTVERQVVTMVGEEAEMVVVGRHRVVVFGAKSDAYTQNKIGCEAHTACYIGKLVADLYAATDAELRHQTAVTAAIGFIHSDRIRLIGPCTDRKCRQDSHDCDSDFFHWLFVHHLPL